MEKAHRIRNDLNSENILSFMEIELFVFLVEACQFFMKTSPNITKSILKEVWPWNRYGRIITTKKISQK